VAGFSGLLLVAMYPLYALYKGELLEHAGRNSLLGTAKWQLIGRESSGSLLDPSSPTAHMVGQWLGIDRWLLLAGLVAIPVALLAGGSDPRSSSWSSSGWSWSAAATCRSCTW
jgi:hypothetical protein